MIPPAVQFGPCNVALGYPEIPIKSNKSFSPRR
jgi:hypothetical protein